MNDLNDEKNTTDPTLDSVVKAEPPKSSGSDEPRRPFDELTSSVRELAQKLPDSIGRIPGSIGAAIQSALSPRDQSVLVYINDDLSKSLDMLVTAEIFGSRSEAAEFLMKEGLKAQQELFGRIQDKVQQIERLKSELKGIVPH